jgi:hypothetical protein
MEDYLLDLCIVLPLCYEYPMSSCLTLPEPEYERAISYEYLISNIRENSEHWFMSQTYLVRFNN